MKTAAGLHEPGQDRADSTEQAIERAIEVALRGLARTPPAAADMVAAIASLCTRGGKRIRPRLCVLGYEGVAGEPCPPGVYTFAAGVELLHAFMLVHDDLIDDAATRRGGPSVHALLARSPAVGPDAPPQLARDLAMLAGDLLFALAADTMFRAALPAARVRRASAAVLGRARDAAVGEYLDVLYGARSLDSLSSADLAEVLRLKTAGYTFEAPLLAGAILARAEAPTRRALAAFGGRVGTAFQLADDLLDLYGDAQRLGKPVGGDIRQGKRTVLLRLALERCTPAEAARVTAILEARDASDAEVREVAALVARAGAAAEVVARITALVRAATRALGRAGLGEAARAQLQGLATDVIASVKGVGEELS